MTARLWGYAISKDLVSRAYFVAIGIAFPFQKEII